MPGQEEGEKKMKENSATFKEANLSDG